MPENARCLVQKWRYISIPEFILIQWKKFMPVRFQKGAWHTVEVYESSVIFEAKDGAYGNDENENLRTT